MAEKNATFYDSILHREQNGMSRPRIFFKDGRFAENLKYFLNLSKALTRWFNQLFATQKEKNRLRLLKEEYENEDS